MHPRKSKKIQYVRCDRTRSSNRNFTTDEGTTIARGCRKIGTYDGNSILHYPTTLLLNIKENGRWVDKNLTVLTLHQSAHDLCENGKCNPGQRDGLSVNDIKDIEFLYGTNCCEYHSILSHKSIDVEWYHKIVTLVFHTFHLCLFIFSYLHRWIEKSRRNGN